MMDIKADLRLGLLERECNRRTRRTIFQYGSVKENCSENVEPSETEGSFPRGPTYALIRSSS